MLCRIEMTSKGIGLAAGVAASVAAGWTGAAAEGAADWASAMGRVSRRTSVNFRGACVGMGWSILCLELVTDCGTLRGGY